MSREIGFGMFLILVLASALMSAIFTAILYLVLSPIVARVLHPLFTAFDPLLFWAGLYIVLWIFVMYVVYAAFWRGSYLR